MPDQDNTVSIRKAARLAGIKRQPVDKDTPEHERPANQPGAEASAVLDAMLAASRRGKTVRGSNGR